MIRIFPYAAAQFTSFEFYKKVTDEKLFSYETFFFSGNFEISFRNLARKKC